MVVKIFTHDYTVHHLKQLHGDSNKLQRATLRGIVNFVIMSTPHTAPH